MTLEIHSAGSPLLDVANLHVAGANIGTPNRNCQFLELHHPIFHLDLLNTPLKIDPTN
ncbi:hypothetical protein [Spirosoma montaniterrae]|uniref:hypothetical protein n=1 Tax=Spirosoma montaniterrae TaxID=1178516 RepID=UPI0012F97673|nr:hypothetical protein [Spirosoma montaniterrae]